MTRHYALTGEPLDEVAVRQCVDQPGVGAIVTFIGQVRNVARDHKLARDYEVERLEYEAYPEMVEATFEDIARDVRKKFDVIDVAIHHRTGMLEIGDVSVVIAVSAAHRGPAFEACRYAIDRLKLSAPIWKKEHTPDGAVWVEDRP